MIGAFYIQPSTLNTPSSVSATVTSGPDHGAFTFSAHTAAAQLANDNFANAQLWAGNEASIDTSNSGASMEANEPTFLTNEFLITTLFLIGLVCEIEDKPDLTLTADTKIRGLAIWSMVEGIAHMVADPCPPKKTRKCLYIKVHFRHGGRRAIMRLHVEMLAKLNYPDRLFTGRV